MGTMDGVALSSSEVEVMAKPTRRRYPAEYKLRILEKPMIDEKAERQIVQAKLQGGYRSTRLIRDLLGLWVYQETIRLVLVKHHLERTSLPPVMPIRRFEAAEVSSL